MMKVTVLGGVVEDSGRVIEGFEGILAGFMSGYAIVVNPSGEFISVPHTMLRYMPQPIFAPKVDPLDEGMLPQESVFPLEAETPKKKPNRWGKK